MKSLLKKLTAILLVLNIILPYLNIGLIKSYAEEAAITNAQVYFRNTATEEITTAEPLQKVQLNFQIGIASDVATEPRDVRIEISDANFYFEDFHYDSNTGKYLYSVELYSGGPVITMELIRNGDGTQTILVKNLEQGQTVNLNLGGYFTNSALPGESVTATIEEGNSVTLSVTNVPSGVTATNTKTVSKSSISFTDGNTSEMASQFPITYTIGANVTIASQYQATETINKLNINDTITFPDGMYINSSANIADYISVGNTSAFSSSDFSPVYSSDNSKIIGISLNKDITGDNISEYLSNGATISLLYGSDMKIEQDGTLSNTVTTGYETTHFSGNANSVTVTTSIDVKEGPKFEENNKYVSDYSGGYISIWNGGDSNGYFIQNDTVTFTLTAKNTGDEAGNVTINDLIPEGTSVVSSSPSGSSSIQNINGSNRNVMTWSFNDVAAGETVTATITLKIDNNENYTIQNKMYLNNDYTSEVASSKEFEVKTRRAEIKPSKTYSSTGGDFTNPGDTVTYTITVTNTGSAVTTIPIYDEFPSELNFVSCTGGGTFIAAHQEQNGDQTINVPAKVDWGNVEIDVGQTVTYEVVATVKDGVTGYINNKVKADDKEASVSTRPFDENIINNFNITKTTDTTYAEKDEVVDYTIRVGNHSGFNIRLSDLTDGKLIIQDILPTFLTYEGGAYYILPGDENQHTDGISYSDNIIYFEINSSDLAVFEKNKVIEIHVPSKVISDAPEGEDREITNIAKVGESAATATIKQRGTSGISFEKYIAEIKDNNNNTIFTTKLNSNTEPINVSVGSDYYITYSTRIYNNSNNAITLDEDNGYFEDNPMFGLFAENKTYFVIDANVKDNVNITVTDSNGSVINNLTGQLGYYYDHYNENSYNMQFDLSGTEILAHDYITVTYTYKTHSSSVQGDINQFDFVKANNTIRTKADSSTSQEVKNYELNPSMSKQVAIVDKSSLPLDADDNLDGNNNGRFFDTLNESFISSLDFGDEQRYSLSQIDGKYFVYKVVLDMKKEVDNTYILTDTISDNLEFVPNNAAACGALSGPIIAIYREVTWPTHNYKGLITYNYNIINPSDITVSGNTLSVKLKVDEAQPTKYCVELYYLVRLKDGVYDDLETKFENKEISVAELLNNANIKTEELDENDNPIFDESDDAPVYVKEGQIHPGLEKEYLGSFADGVQEFDENGNPKVTIGASNPGAHLVWKMTVTNPEDDYATTMKNYRVIEKLPEPYVFDDNYLNADYTGDTYKPIIEKLDKNGEVIKSWVGNDADNPFVMPTFSGENNRTLTWDFSGDVWALAPGESLEIIIPTKVVGAGVNGTFLNTAELITEQDFDKTDVSNGTYMGDNTIEDNDFANISLYVTSSHKEIEYDPSLEQDVDYEQPAYDTGIGKKVDDVLDNTVQGHQGEKVKYTLNIKNESPVRLADMIVIDRFPYVGDIGVIADYERKSSFEVKWDSFISAKVYDSDGNYSRTIDSSKIRITFSDEKEEVFPYGVGEWDGNDSGNTNVTTWSATPTDDTVNVRFEFVNDDNTYLASQETLKIEFYGIVPAYVDTDGEENIAWNNFAYGYMPVDSNGISISNYNIAEPAKVGIWVEELEKVDIPVKKTWSDYNNADNTRPESVTIKLLADNVVVDQHNVTAADNWEYTFENKPVRNGQNERINYTIEEVEVPNYTSTVTGFTVNNVYTATTTVSGTKTWNDKNNNDDTRPASITVNLFANDSYVTSKTVSADVNGNWEYEFSGLDKYDSNNQLIVYTITEDTVTTKDGTGTYTSEINGTNITNTYIPKTSISGTKTWNDYNNIDGTRPQSIVVNLVKAGEIIDSKTVSANANGNWEYEFTGLDKYDDNNQLIQYSISENPVANYTATINGYDIENKYTAKVNVTGTKTWNDYNNKEDTRPDSIKVKLFRNDVNIDEKTVTSANNWTFSFDNLDKYYNDNGVYREYAYTITEDTVTTKDGTGEYTSEVVPGSTSNTFSITNTYEIKTSYKIKKVWNDAENQDGDRPDTITVQLYANNVAQGSPVTLSNGVDGIWQENELSYEWQNLDKYDSSNNLIVYTATETDVSEDYTITYDRTTEENTTIVTNAKTPEETEYTVKKVWNDANNQDGKRPTNIEVQLKANGNAYGEKVTLETGSDNTWDEYDLTYTWNNLPKYSNGTEITYSIEETAIGEGYTATYDTESEDKTTIITNTRATEETEYTVKKVWNDSNNQDGKRPTNIEVQLKANGNAYGEKVTLETGSDNTWDESDLTYTWNNLPKYSNGTEITYSVEETAIGKGYTATYDTESEDKTTIITNTRAPEETEYTVKKVWNDANNQDGKRPLKIEVQLKANGNAYGEKVTLETGTDNTWDESDLTYTWSNLPKYNNGQEIEYSVKEDVLAEGYTATYDTESEDKTTIITNTRAPEETEYTVKKVWNDANNQDGKRPPSIVVQLKANGNAYGEKVTLETGTDNTWDESDLTYTWSNLPKYNNGQEIEYSVEEDALAEGYTATYDTESEDKTTIITNTRAIEETDYTVKKVWNDANNQDGKRPTSITVQLKGNGYAVRDAVILSAGADGVWDESDLTYTWNNLQKNSNGTPIIYTVEETAIGNGYTTTYDTSVDGVTTITNSYTPGEVNYSVEKIWNDANNQDGNRPESIEVELQANGTAFVYDGITARQTLNESNSWKYTWEHLPEKQNGQTVEYKVKEITSVSEYNEPTYDYTTGKTTITNSHTTEKTTYEVEKVWNDSNNQDGTRSPSVSVQLKARKKVNGEYATVNEGESQTLEENNSWKYTWNNLEKNSEGEAVEYSVEELGEITGYTTEYDTSKTGKTTIINNHTTEKTTYEVEKVWNDSNNQDGTRSPSISVQLKARKKVNGEYVTVNEGESQTLEENNSWKYTWNNLEKNSEGEAIEYSVEELGEITGYTTEYDTSKTGKTTITNNHITEKTTYEVEKVWNDSNDQDRIRPESISVQLKARKKVNGEYVTVNVGESQTLEENNSWKYTWNNLEKNSEGEAIEYSVEELGEITGYTTEYDTSKTGKTTITNNHTTEKTTYEVEKVWNDSNNQDGKRPPNIQVQLKKNGNNLGDAITLNSDNEWKYEWTNLDKNENGLPISYSAEEVGTIVDYTTSSSVTSSKTTITNSREKEKTTYYVKKVWNDSNNQDGIRPASITVQLKANKKVNDTYTIVNVGDIQTLSAANNWEYTWNNLDKNSEGALIEYSIVELGEITGYTISYDTSVSGKTTITNAHTPEETTYTVKKLWNDKDNQDGKRPPSIVVQLKANGNAYGDSVTLSTGEDNSWDESDLTYTWNNLPKNNNGKTIIYTVEETAIGNGYTTTYDTSVEGVTTITNSYTPGEVVYSVEKVWGDSNNQDNKRPASIEVELQINGVAFVYEGITARQTLNSSNSWSYTWEHLPEKLNGNTVTYTIAEITNLEDYNEPTYLNTSNKTTITNARTTDKTTYSVEKVWDDANNQDGIRPASINVQLKAKKMINGELVVVDEGSVQTLNADNNWKYNWTNLEKNSEGTLVEYSVAELGKIDGYTSECDTSTDGKTIITNTHTPDVTTYSVEKVWDDKNNQDGKRPTKIEVQLKANGNAYGEKVTLETGIDNKWDESDLTYTWNNLPKYSNGKEIKYSVEEQAINNGYSVTYDNETYTDKTVIKNSYTPGEVSYSAVKVWDDNNNQDGKRPDAVLVELIAKVDNEEITIENVVKRQLLNKDNQWKYTWNRLPQMSNGKTINYSVAEISKYSDYNDPTYEYGNGLTTVINTHIPEKTSKSVEKIWNDNDNQDGIRPQSIKVQLKANGNAYGSEVTLNSNNNWKYTWSDLDVYANGSKITYEVVENSTVTGYEVSSSVDGDKTTIVNKHIPEETEYSVEKVWDDKNNQDGVRPVSVKVQLYANGIAYRDSIFLEAGFDGVWQSDELTYTWKNLPKYANGNKIAYTVEEIDSNSNYIVTTSDSDGKTIITNRHVPEETYYTVEKIWIDNDNQDGIRPTKVEIKLKADGVVVKEATLSDANHWKVTWNNLDKYSKGELIKYSVEEINVSDGYTDTYDYSVDGIVVIQNKHIPEETSYTVEKIWSDRGNVDNIRPDSIKVQLYANGEKYGTEKTLQVGIGNKWTEESSKYTWENLPKRANGQLIEYTVEEVEVPGGYNVAYMYDEGITYINNIHIPPNPKPHDPVVAITGKKIWNDNNDEYGIRPKGVTIRLLKDGELIMTYFATSDKNWEYEFTDLPKFDENGREIVYTISEKPVDGYTSKVEGTNIINTIIPKIEEPKEPEEIKEPEEKTISIKTGDKIIINIIEFAVSVLIIVGYSIGKKRKDNK